jgi:hypothetical protein
MMVNPCPATSNRRPCQPLATQTCSFTWTLRLLRSLAVPTPNDNEQHQDRANSCKNSNSGDVHFVFLLCWGSKLSLHTRYRRARPKT